MKSLSLGQLETLRLKYIHGNQRVFAEMEETKERIRREKEESIRRATQ